MPLGIDFAQIFLHLFNVVILFGGLYLILYKPVKEFMLKRENYYEKMRDTADERLQEAEKLKAEYEGRFATLEDEIRERKQKAEQALEDEKLQSDQEAMASAAKIIEDAKMEAERQRSLIVGGAREDIARMIEEAASKVMFEGADASGFDTFLDEAEGVRHG